MTPRLPSRKAEVFHRLQPAQRGSPRLHYEQPLQVEVKETKETFTTLQNDWSRAPSGSFARVEGTGRQSFGPTTPAQLEF